MWDLGDSLVPALVGRLETELPGAITAINGTVTDGVTLTPPARVLGFVPPPELLTDMPVVGVSLLDTRVEDDIGAVAESIHRVGVVAYVADPDPAVLAVRLRRWVRAIAVATLPPERRWGPLFGARLDRVDWGPTLATEEEPRTWVSWAALILEARMGET